jgi:hypothetical protein
MERVRVYPDPLLLGDQHVDGTVGGYADSHGPGAAADSAILDEHLIPGGFEIHVGAQVDFARLAAVRAIVLLIHEVIVRFEI